MGKIKDIVSLFWQLLNQFLPLILLQAATYSILSAYYILLRPILMQSLFSALESVNLNQTVEVCVLYTCLLLAGVAFCYVNNVILDSRFYRIMHDTIADIFSRWHVNRNEIEDEGTVFQDVTDGATSMVGAPIHFFNFFMTAGVLIYLLFISEGAFRSLPWILSIVFTILVGVHIWQFRLLRKRRDIQQERCGAAEEDFQQLISEIQVLRQHDYFEQRRETYKACRLNAWKAKFAVERGGAAGEFLTNTLIAFAFAGLFVTVLLEENRDFVTVANVAVAVALLQSVAQNVGELMCSLRCVADVVVPLERVSELLHDTTEHTVLDTSKPAVSIECGREYIKLEKGQKAAIVGCNGSGKTTLLNQIAGIPYQRLDVKISVFGQTAENLSFENRRQVISVAPKEENLFDASTEENILMNAEDYEDEKLWKIVNVLQAEELLDYRKSQLSGGQAKMTNLLRSCIHDCSVLLVDEPTSSLDGQNAGKAMELLYETAKEKLLVAVTHDMEVLKDFDLILYMENLSLTFAGDYTAFLESPYYEKLQKNVKTILDN